MKYLDQRSTDPHFNMAHDEYCLESLVLDVPFFYLWRNSPSVIIGLNQSAFTEVNLPYLKEKGILLARRTTGGGAVYHDLQNLNYSFCFPQGADCNPVELVASALRAMGVPAEVSGRNDILVDGRKCSGYAKRHWKDRVIVHGTLMFNVDIQSLTEALSVQGSKLSSKGIASVRSRVGNLKDYLPEGYTIESFKSELQRILANGDSKIVLSAASKADIEHLADSRFRKDDWIYGRSPLSGIVREQRFDCGTIRCEISVFHGIIKDIQFSGDFIGRKNVSQLEEVLISCQYLRESVNELITFDIGDYFDGMDKDKFVSFLLG